jgi:hypothetical protein
LIFVTAKRPGWRFYRGARRDDMMTLTDCAALCVLDYEDVQAIAEYDHVPEIADATLSAYLSQPIAGGASAVCKRMIEDVRSALDDCLVHHATEIVMALRQFLDDNPGAAPGTTFH